MKIRAFKNTEVGPIPVDWEVKRLGKVASVITKGTTPTSVGCEFVRHGINFIKAESISDNGSFLNQMFAHIDERTNTILSRSVLKEGDFLFSIAGVLGRVALVPANVLPANTNQALAIIRIDEKSKICRNFLFFALKSECIKGQIIEENVAAAQANLSLQEIGKLGVALPPLSEQCRIAAALSDADAWIESLDKLIEKKKLVKQGTMQALLSGKTRLPGFASTGNAKKMSEFGQIPQDWAVKKLGELCSRIKNGFSYDYRQQGGVPISRIETISSGKIDYSRVGMSRTEPPPEYKLQKGDILYSHINSLQYIGNVAQYEDNRTLYHGMNLLLLRAASSVDYKYLFYMLSSSFMREQAQMLAKVAINQASIGIRDLSGCQICIAPSLAEQKAIAGVLSDIDEEIAALEAEKAKASQIKQGMMQELLTGRVRLGEGE